MKLIIHSQLRQLYFFGCNCISICGLVKIHSSKRGPWWHKYTWSHGVIIGSGTKQLPDTIMTCCQLDPWAPKFLKFESKYEHWISLKKKHYKMLHAKLRPFWSGLDILSERRSHERSAAHVSFIMSQILFRNKMNQHIQREIIKQELSLSLVVVAKI